MTEFTRSCEGREGPVFFSLGYRCSSAGLLKKMGLKHESFPFDWMVSRLPIIRDCLYKGFDKFMDVANYERGVAATWHYVCDKGADGKEYIKKQQFICEEKFVYNTYYENKFGSGSGLGDGGGKELLVPFPVSVPKDAYGYNLIMNHKNICEEETREYYQRCISRWNLLMASPCEKIGVYIHPLVSHETYNKNHFQIRRIITDFHRDMGDITSGYRGIYVIPVRWEEGSSTQNMERDEYEEYHRISPVAIPSLIRISGVNMKMSYTNPVFIHCPISDMYLFVLYTREDFIDAGEIFMGHCDKETDLLGALVSKVGNKEDIAYSLGIEK